MSYPLFASLWPQVKGFSWSPLRILGMFPVMIVSVIIASGYIVMVICTINPNFSSHPILCSILSLGFHFIIINLEVSYFLCVFADPGSIPKHWQNLQSLVKSVQSNDVSMLPSPTTTSSLTSTAIPSHGHPIIQAGATEIVQTSRIAFVQTTTGEVADFLPSVSNGVLIESNDLNMIQQPSLPPSSSNAASISQSQKEFLLKFINERTPNGGFRYCNKCNHFKPDRSHHCSTCGRCILKMDHHCVFVNNCVGFFNQKFFLLFLLYAFMGCAAVTFGSFHVFWKIIKSQLAGQKQLAAKIPFKVLVLVAYIIISAFTFALFLFLAFHLYLVHSGRTTIEMYERVGQVRSIMFLKYDQGFKRNWRTVFGRNPWLWFLPTRRSIEGDGCFYHQLKHGEESA